MSDLSAAASTKTTSSTSPKLGTKQGTPAVKKEKSKYQAFRSDDDEESDIEDADFGRNRKQKIKREKPNASFKVKIIGMKSKKKDKDKEKKKKVKKDQYASDEAIHDVADEPFHEPVFGVPLDVAVDRSAYPDRIALPRIVRDCILYVEEKGLSEEGIYRISGVKSRVDQLKQLFNQGKEINMEDYDPECVASLLKLYLRELPSNILTTRLAPIFDAYISCGNSDEQLAKYQQLIHDLPCPNRTLLAWLFTHFSHILEKGSENKMNIQNISIVFSPTMSISHGVLNLLFQFTKELFPDVQLIKYIPPSEETENEEPSLDMICELEETLRENEELLTELHGRINQGEENQKVMDELWERQRKSTQLKRKIKTLKKKLNTNQISTNIPISKTEENVSMNSLSSDNIRLEENEKNIPQPVESETPRKDSIEKTQEVSEQETLNVKRSRKPIQNENVWTAEIIKKEENDFTENIETLQDTPVELEKVPVAKNITITESQEKSLSTGSLASNTEKDTVRRLSMDNLNNNATADSELESLLLEEQRLIIENEELDIINNELKMLIEKEEKHITTLQSHLENRENSSHSSMSSSSSKSSISSSSNDNSSTIDDIETSSFEEISNLELQLEQLEEENIKLENDCDVIVEKILYEKQEIIKYKTSLRMKYMHTAVK